MRITQGTFSFLPDLSDAQITKQLEYCLDKGWAVGIEYTDDPHPAQHLLGDARQPDVRPEGRRRHPSWRSTPAAKTFPDQYIRVTAFDSTHGVESVVLSFIVNRPRRAGFRLVRTEEPGRTMRYSIESYAVAQRPKGAVLTGSTSSFARHGRQGLLARDDVQASGVKALLDQLDAELVGLAR